MKYVFVVPAVQHCQ